jgi:manganese transport protein
MMVPAFVVVAAGADPTNALVMSEIVLSIPLPFPMIALVLFTRLEDIMGRFANRAATHAAAGAGTAVVLALNLFLVLQSFEPGLS